MMNRKIVTLVLSLFLTVFGFSGKNAKSEIDKKIDEAYDHFQYEEFEEAIKMYTELYEQDSTNGEYAYCIGVSYIHSNHNEKALPYLLAAEKANYFPKGPHIIEWDEAHRKYYSLDLNFNIGRAYHLHHDFDEALKYYSKVENSIEEDFHGHKHDLAIAAIEHFKKMARSGINLLKNPVEGVRIENLGEVVNSEFEEIAPVISADESTLIFTSRRPNTTGGTVSNDGKYMEDIYISTKEDGEWAEPQKISDNINTAEQDAAVALSPDGQDLILYKSNHHGTGDLYHSTNKGGSWTSPEVLEAGINTRHWENSASISADGKIMIFTSTRPHGFGREDLYMVTKTEDDVWGEPKNLGTNINTEYDEDAPFIMADGRTMYFSSRGHNSMGGFDIFKTTYDEKKEVWSKPQNVGYPINTANDDIFFVWSPDGKRAYFSSHHEDGYGDQDLYVMYLPENSTENVSTVMVTGRVSDEKGVSVDAEIKVIDNTTGEMVATFHPNKRTGKYTVVLPTGRNYGVSIEGEGFIPYSQNIDLPTGDYHERLHDIVLKKLEKGSVVALRNVFFEKNSADLREESFHELDKFSDILKSNPKVLVEIAGHTDSDGQAAYNKTLSQKRAQSVVDYVVKKGIPKSQMIAVGYGEEEPVATNQTDEGKQENRRVEMIVHNGYEKGGTNWIPYYQKLKVD